MKNIFNALNKTKFKYGTNSVIVTVGFIVIVILLNVFVGALSQKVTLKLDLTKEKIFTLDKATKDVLSKLTGDIYIYYLSKPNSEVVNQVSSSVSVSEVLEKYKLESDKIHVETIDPATNPTFGQKYVSAGEELSEGSLIVDSGIRYRIITPDQMFEGLSSDYFGGIRATGFKLEQQLTNAISYVSSEKTIKVVYTSGHAEDDFSTAKSVLESQNITVSEINLATGEIPSDASILFIYGPEKDFGAEEINKIDAYCDAGGNLQIFINPLVSLPRLENYLGEWGIGLGNNIILETDKSRIINNNPTYIIPELTSNEYTENIINNKLNMLMPLSRSVSVEAPSGYKSEVIMKTSNKAEARAITSDGRIGDPVGTGEYSLAVMSSKYIDPTSDKTAKVFVFGTSQCLSLLMESNLANNEFFVRSVSYLTESGLSTISISSKSLQLSSLNIPALNQLIYIGFFLILLPIGILVTGLVVWLRRRHL